MNDQTRLYEEGLADDKDGQDREEEGPLRLLQHCCFNNHLNFIFPSASVAFLYYHTTLQLALVSVAPFCLPHIRSHRYSETQPLRVRARARSCTATCRFLPSPVTKGVDTALRMWSEQNGGRGGDKQG